MKTVIFACVHNAGRSQMAAALFNAQADPARAQAISAGTRPGSAVHPEVLAVMKEIGLDLSQARPQFLSDELAARADWLITMGCGEACPHIAGVKRQDWPLQDPKGQPVEAVRKIRGEISQRIGQLLASQGWGRV